jgi:hypothetical protein
MQAKTRWISYLFCAIVIAFAVSYFLLTYDRTFNPIDEGLLLNNFQKTAGGQIVHRDFYDVYGPASYWVGGTLFSLFGSKIMVIRMFLVILKLSMAALILMIARKIVPLFFGLIAGFLFILNWGDPFSSAFNIMYAGHFSHFLLLGGIFFMIVYVERGNRVWLLGTGMCVALSLLFKLHTALIALMGFGIFLGLKEQVSGFSLPDPDTTNEVPYGGLIVILRAMKCVATLCVMAFYLALFARYHLDPPYFFMFLFPLFLFLGHILYIDLKSFHRDKISGPCRAGLKTYLCELLVVLMCPVLVWILEVAYYYRLDALDKFFFDMFSLPLRLEYYRQMADYRLHAGAAAAVVIILLSIGGVGKRLKKRNRVIRMLFGGVVAALLLMLPLIVLVRGTPVAVWHTRMIHLLPPITLLTTACLFLDAWGTKRLNGGDEKKLLVVGLLFICASQTYLISFPRTDEAHIQLNITVLFLLVSFLLWRLYTAWKRFLPEFGRGLGVVSVLSCLTLVVVPYLWSMKIFLVPPDEFSDTAGRRVRHSGESLARPEDSLSLFEINLPRSEGLEIPLWYPNHYPFIFIDIAQISFFLRENTARDEKIFLLCELQIIYFLAERGSILQEENYFVHLATMGLIDSADDVRLTDEQFLEKVKASKPRFVIWARQGEHTKRIVALWPETGRFIRDNYVPAGKVGAIYEILRRQDNR